MSRLISSMRCWADYWAVDEQRFNCDLVVHPAVDMFKDDGDEFSSEDQKDL